MFIESFKVESPNVKYTENEIHSVYNYETTELVHESRNGTYQWVVKPKTVKYEFKTETHVPKLGVMLVGWGGNNGSTLTAGVIANREGISWATKDKVQQANYFGSLTQASTIRVGSFNGEEIYAPFKSLLPMVNPDDIVFGGWDISDMNLADAMARGKVLDIDLQKQLRPYMESMVPLPGIYDPDFIAANQGSRANNVIKGTKKEQVQQIIKDIREFKEANKVDKVVVLWTANTERYSNVTVGLNDTVDNLFASLDKNEAEISPSTLYALACILENIPFINGSPQNTFVPGLIDLAIKRNSLIGGDDFKSGQTKMKSVLVDFLVGAGIKPTSIVSYNHLGNNDGMNLSAPQTFRSKEISKSNVVVWKLKELASTIMESIVGYRFHPTDEELVDHYLRLKRLGKDSEVRAIAEVDICKWEPYDLPKLSVIKSDDQEWFFFCRRELKYSSSHRTNRATKSGYWKATGNDRKIKAKRTNKVIGKKKTLVFHIGRVPNGVGTDWVIHEYHSTSTHPHQKDFVLCRLMKKHDGKTDVSTCDEVEASSYPASDFESRAPNDSIFEVHFESQAPNDSIFEPEADLEPFFQPTFQQEGFDFEEFTVSNTQGSPFIDPLSPNSRNNELNWMQFQSDRDEQEEDTEFLNSLIVDQDENSQEEIRHFRDIREPESLQKVYLYAGGPSSDTDTDNAQSPCDRLMGTSSLFNEHVSPQEVRHQALKLQSGTVSSSSANHDQYRSRGSSFHHDDLMNILRPSINCLSRVRPKSPAKVRTSTPQHQHRLRQSAGQRVAHRRVQLQYNNSHRIVSHDKAKDASRDSITTSLPQKETSIMDSDKEQKMAQCTNTKKSLKSTTLDSAGSDRKGYFIFVEASQQSHVSSPPLVYLAKLLFGLFLFLVFIREVVVYGM